MLLELCLHNEEKWINCFAITFTKDLFVNELLQRLAIKFLEENLDRYIHKLNSSSAAPQFYCANTHKNFMERKSVREV